MSSVADSSLGSLSNQKRDVEWLEIIINDILKFANFKATRQAYITLDESGQNSFFVDVLAIDFHLEIFVECKELKDLKTSEKIVSDFIDQINHYRRSLGRRVIGILATTSDSDVYNTGIREKLKNENSFLWDDAFVDYLKNKMIEIKDKNEFQKLIANRGSLTIEDVYNEYLDGLHALLKKAYGVSYVLESIDPYETICCEGGKAEYDNKLYSTLISD
ncbi:MAG: hypothetical protein WD512_06320 [Candidatus Paceibacterota bacterium]